jgi:hypothetical protein
MFSSMFLVSPILLSVPLRLMLNLLSTRLAGFCVSDTVPRFGVAASWRYIPYGIQNLTTHTVSRTVAKSDNTHTKVDRFDLHPATSRRVDAAAGCVLDSACL